MLIDATPPHADTLRAAAIIAMLSPCY